jgi:hypothetical protein
MTLAHDQGIVLAAYASFHGLFTKTSSSLHNDFAFIAGPNFKIKTSFTGSKSSHLDACTSMEHAHLL